MGSEQHTKTTKQHGGRLGKIAASLNKKLQSVEWGEYRIGDLFEKLNLKFKRKDFQKDKDISRERTKEFNLPLVNAKDGDNGIMYYGREQDFESTGLTIDIVNDGAVSTGNVYPQPQKTGVLYNAYLIKPLFNVSEKLLYFFATTIQKSIKLKFGYENKAGWEKVKKEIIQLPTKNGKIDFAFMESFIAELEAERIAELEAYLVATELKNYTLTTQEQQALDEFEKGKIEWGGFKMGDLFVFEAIKQAKSQKEIPTDNSEKGIPYIVQSMFNNMVSRTVNKKWLIDNDEAPVSGNRIVLGVTLPAVSYQSREFGASQVITARVEWLNEKSGNFISTVISKLMYQFSYNNKPGMQIYKDMVIQLPTQKSKIDFEFIEHFITAIQKTVIREVVQYADLKIAATQTIINH